MKKLKERYVMGEVRIVQVGIVVNDLKEAVKRYYHVLGFGPWSVYKYAPPEMENITYRGNKSDLSFFAAFTWVDNLQIELIQPLNGPSIYHEHLEKKGEGLHHIKEYVDDAQKVIEEFKRKGIEVIQSGRFGPGEYYYFDTEPVLGITFEISTGGGRKHREPDWRYPG
jgi:catechol 2,3-dioxygenase-like lactoylglutathione lyase family enzyme